MTEAKTAAPAKQGQGKPVNMQFAVLSALGMFFVVDGHLNNSYLDIGGLFPYYAFHMPLFAFISGYFYRQGSEDGIGAYAKRKAARLLVPYMIYNLLYGIVTQVLHGAGFAFGGSLNLQNLFIEPFITGHQFEYNLAAWFVPALFLVEITNVLLRRFVKMAFCRGRMLNEYMVAALYMALGTAGICLALGGRYQGGWLTLVRLMFLLPCFQWGTLYRQRIEEKDRLGNILYFAVLMSFQLGLVMLGRPLIYSVAFCNGFTGLLLPYITAAAGIAFWLRVSRIAAGAFSDSAAMRYLGGHTFAIMMHHVMALMVLKTVFAAFAKYTSLFVGFSFEQYKADLWYLYFPKGLPQFRVFYLIWAMALPLVFQYVLDRIKQRLKTRSRAGSHPLG